MQVASGLLVLGAIYFIGLVCFAIWRGGLARFLYRIGSRFYAAGDAVRRYEECREHYCREMEIGVEWFEKKVSP